VCAFCECSVVLGELSLPGVQPWLNQKTAWPGWHASCSVPLMQPTPSFSKWPVLFVPLPAGVTRQTETRVLGHVKKSCLCASVSGGTRRTAPVAAADGRP